MKPCISCRVVKPLDDYYRHPEMLDGHLGKCKECQKRDVKVAYARNREARHLYEKARNATPHRREIQTASQRRQRSRSPEKDLARRAVADAIRTGEMIRQPCSSCGAEKSEAHHPDYFKPLDVMWLCFRCHRMEHGQVVTAQ